MVEVIDWRTRIPHLIQKDPVIDVDVQEELCLARDSLDSLPYLDQQPKFVSALASTYNAQPTKNQLTLSSQKRGHLTYTTGRSSRCICSLSK